MQPHTKLLFLVYLTNLMCLQSNVEMRTVISNKNENSNIRFNYANPGK